MKTNLVWLFNRSKSKFHPFHNVFEWRQNKHSLTFGGRVITYLFFLLWIDLLLKNMNDRTGSQPPDLWPPNKTCDYDLVQANYSQLVLMVVLLEK